MISLVVAALLIKLSDAVDHTVGGLNGGWDTSIDLKSWASSNTFVVGDSLGKFHNPQFPKGKSIRQIGLKLVLCSRYSLPVHDKP